MLILTQGKAMSAFAIVFYLNPSKLSLWILTLLDCSDFFFYFFKIKVVVYFEHTFKI